MNPVEIAKGVYQVGAIDWNIRDFHGYSTPGLFLSFNDGARGGAS